MYDGTGCSDGAGAGDAGPRRAEDERTRESRSGKQNFLEADRPGSQVEAPVFFVPEHAYAALVENLVDRGGLPGSSFPESAEILSEQVGWIVDADALRVAWSRNKKKREARNEKQEARDGQ